MRLKKLWAARWKPDDDQSWQRSGGQGKLRLLRPVDDPDAPVSVLKELNNQTDPDRRRRMRREVVTLETLPHAFTPRVLDHNTDRFADPDVDLYAVFEFIPGPTLAEHVAEQGPLPLEHSIALAAALLAILEVYHDVGSGHRDIKPDNIILRNGDPRSPVLIDFGLTFNIDEPSSTDTPDWQQVGNRFLALPEHAAFSGNKRDLRSDLTFCVGILFFALTGTHPATLSDEEGRLPHQRPAARMVLDTIPGPSRLTLLSVFDIGFSPNLAHRWQSIDALRSHIERMVARVANEDLTEASIADIRARAAAKSGNLVIKKTLDRMRARLYGAAHVAIRKLGDGFEPHVSERLTTMHDMSTSIRCGVAHVYDGGLTNTFFRITAVGDELVIAEVTDDHATGGDIVARVPLEVPETLPELNGLIERRIIENVHRNVAGA